MKHYKEYRKESIGASDISSLILRAPGQLELLHFGSDGAYSAYIVDENCEIPSHYKLAHAVSPIGETLARTWLKIYDDDGLTKTFFGGGINIYRAGAMGCIVQIFAEKPSKERRHDDALVAMCYSAYMQNNIGHDRPETTVEDIVERELSEFKKTISADSYAVSTERQFFSVLNYPFAKAGDVIKALRLFEERAAEYLKESRPGEFALLSDHCLHVYVASMAPPFGAYVVGKKEERLRK